MKIVNTILEDREIAYQESTHKYFQTFDVTEEILADVNHFIQEKLYAEYPTAEYLEKKASGLEENIELFHNLAMSVQEDLAILRIKDNRDWLCALHLCFPNHWSAEEKIGNNFISIHEIVPGMKSEYNNYRPLLDGVIRKGPYYRFAWGLGTDNRLNHHPVPPQGFNPLEWIGRSFDLANPVLFIRTERQTLKGFPERNCFLFTIRTYFTDVTELNHQELRHLVKSIESMSPDVLSYKGLASSKESILKFLNSLING